MSAISARLIGERRGRNAGSLAKTYTQRWRVETDSRTDEPAVVLAHASLPRAYVTLYDADTSAICTSVEATEEGDDFKSWIVTAEFSTIFPANLVDLPDSPLDEPPNYSLSFDQFTTVARAAIDYFNPSGFQPIRNTQGEVLRDPPVEVDHCRAVLVVEKNEASFSGPLAAFYTNSVNASVWASYPARTVKCKSITSASQFQRNSIPYFRTRYEFHLNSDTWDIRVLNEATQYREVANGARKKIADGNKKLIATGNGSLFEGKLITDDMTPSIDDMYLRYRYYPELDFSVFNF